MDKKRYWLVRDKAGLEGYYRFRDDEPPRGSAGLWHAEGSGGALVRGPLVLAPDGTVYGHTLEPGGGPVDVSEWFPEGGRVCTNCGWVQDKACIEPSDPIRAITCAKWKPREQTQGPEMIPVSKADRAMRDTLRWFEDMIYNPQGNPAREDEGGRTMLQTIEYELWQNEKIVEDDANEPRTRLFKGEIQTDKPMSAIRELVIWEKRVLISEAKLTPADVDVVARPFA